tara:strand:+ start:876 stop:1067 length:192 start_codon:yes stop_codon:yes gene_type:complete
LINIAGNLEDKAEPFIFFLVIPFLKIPGFPVQKSVQKLLGVKHDIKAILGFVYSLVYNLRLVL